MEVFEIKLKTWNFRLKTFRTSNFYKTVGYLKKKVVGEFLESRNNKKYMNKIKIFKLKTFRPYSLFYFMIDNYA